MLDPVEPVVNALLEDCDAPWTFLNDAFPPLYRLSRSSCCLDLKGGVVVDVLGGVDEDMGVSSSCQFVHYELVINTPNAFLVSKNAVYSFDYV